MSYMNLLFRPTKTLSISKILIIHMGKYPKYTELIQ